MAKLYMHFRFAAGVASALVIASTLVAQSMAQTQPPLVVGVGVQQQAGTFDATGQAFVKELGVQSLRLAYNHGDHNFGINWASQNGKSVLFMLGYGHGCHITVSAGRQCYADRSAALARTYGSKIKYYEVWNEWNGGFGLGCRWGQAGTPCTNPAMYTDLLCKTYNAIKAVQPSAKVVGGATAGVDINFIAGMLVAGAANCMDMLSVHPYVYTPTRYSVSYQSPGAIGARKFVEAITAANSLIKQYTSKTIRIVVSEEGRSDANSQAHEKITSDYITELFKQAKTLSFLEGIWWYELEDETRDVRGYGLLRTNNTRKLSFTAYKTAAQSSPR